MLVIKVDMCNKDSTSSWVEHELRRKRSSKKEQIVIQNADKGVKIVVMEKRKAIRQNGMGKKVLNTCNQMEQWQSTIYSFLNECKMNMNIILEQDFVFSKVFSFKDANCIISFYRFPDDESHNSQTVIDSLTTNQTC